jgi:hypothetical protein
MVALCDVLVFTGRSVPRPYECHFDWQDSSVTFLCVSALGFCFSFFTSLFLVGSVYAPCAFALTLLAFSL